MVHPGDGNNNHLVEQGRIENGQRVLDLGCGTATLSILIKKSQPGVDVIGIDRDRKIIEVAELKTRKEGVNIPLFDAVVFDLPCRDNYFDRVFASMLFHRLTTKDKILAAEEMYGILKPGVELHVADFGRPQKPSWRASRASCVILKRWTTISRGFCRM